MDFVFMEIVAVIAVCAFFWSLKLDARTGFKQDLWPPTRGFAKLKYWLENKVKTSKAQAVFWTELVSGLLHAPMGYFAAYEFYFWFSPGRELEGARWMALLVFMLWMGFGMGRGSIIERQAQKKSLEGPGAAE
jgi:cobalamin biosynthesis protein CobD/CbiB